MVFSDSVHPTAQTGLSGSGAPTEPMIGTDLSPADYQRLAREIGDGAADSLGVFILSSFSAQFLAPYVVVEAMRLGLPLRVDVAPFMQFEQLVNDVASPVSQAGTRAVIVLMRPEDLNPELYNGHLTDHAIETRLGEIHDRLVGIACATRRHTHTAIVIANAAPPPPTTDNARLVHGVQAFNRQLATTLSEVSDCHVFDWAGAVAAFGASRFVDFRLWYLARIACGHLASVAMAERLSRHLAALFLPRAKCIVVDLDNTLWSGVLGDDGVYGILLGEDYPGNAFRDLQHALKARRARGMLLAVASKNHESVVIEAFENHPDMVLRWSDFACHRVNWRPKPENIREIARELNIGTDAVVFIDDDAVECDAVRRELPEVRTVCLGREPYRFREKLDAIAELDRAVTTHEDYSRAEMYQQDRGRRAAASQLPTHAEFLQTLSMEATVGLCDEANLARVTQLVGKTNQFNLTTRRYGSAELRAMANSADHRVAYLRLRDTYGDLGLVCVGIVSRESIQDWRIDTFLMSCRVMGRGVEDCFLSYLAELTLCAEGTRIIGEYIPSAKNTIVRSFYLDRRFTAIPSKGEIERAAIDLSTATLAWPQHVWRVQETQ